MDLAEREKAFDCLAEHRKPPDVQCFEWMQKARLYLSHEERPEGLNCYTVEWFSLTDKYDPADCFEDGEQYGHWLVKSYNTRLSGGSYNHKRRTTRYNKRTQFSGTRRRCALCLLPTGGTVPPQSIPRNTNPSQQNASRPSGRHQLYFTAKVLGVLWLLGAGSKFVYAYI